MSKLIDPNKFTDVFINSVRAGEMWLRGVMLYVKKRKPTVTLKLEAVDGKVRMTAQFVDYEHRYRYANETEYSTSIPYTHGILYIQANRLGSKPLSLSVSGTMRANSHRYGDDGTFKYDWQPSSNTTSFAYRAWISYIDPDTGDAKVIYTDTLRTSYDKLLSNGPLEG